MIQKTLVFVVDFTGKMIDGEKPVGFLRANDKNKNTIFLITPEQPTTQIKARFLAKTKHNDGVAVNGILTTDYKVNDLVSETKSYYEKIKDWNVFYFPVPERVVNYIASNAGNEIGITFEFVEWQLPRIKDIYGDFLGEITDRRFSIDANEDGYYVNRVIDYEYNGDKYGYNDLFIVGGGTITAIRAFPRTGGAVGGYFGVDPMYDSGVFEYVDGDDIDPSITTQIKNQVNNLTSEVYFLNVDNEKNKTDIATLKTQVSDINVDIVDLDNRVNDNASDIIDLGDDLVNTIKSTCANKLDLAYSSSNNRIAIALKSYDGTSLDADVIDIPKATTTSDGLMSKEDKVELDNKLDEIWTDITNQTVTQLTDILVFNRGSNVYKTTLANLLTHVVPTDIFEVVEELPSTGIKNKIFLVPKQSGEGNNIYEEYIWADSKWELIGSVSVDLTNYYTKTQTDNLLSNKVDSVNGKTGVVTLTKSDVGLENVDNTSDANKPISTAQATAIAVKADKTYVDEQVSTKIDKADIIDNLTTDDDSKVLSAAQGKALQDSKEAVANKAVDFSVVNDTKYPTTKAVQDLVDTMIGDIDTILDSILGV